MRILISTVLVAAVSLAWCGSAVAAIFDHRENVNILNTWNPDLKITSAYGTMPATSWRIYSEAISYEYRDSAHAYDNDITFDFGEVQNIKTIRLHYWAGYQASSFDVFASNDGGVTFTIPVECEYSYASGTGTLVLKTEGGLDTRHLQIVPTGYQNGPGGNEPGRMIIHGIRVFGDVGTLSPKNNNIDLISSTGLAGATPGSPAVTITPVGGVAISPNLGFVDDAYNPLGRTVMYSLNEAGKGFIVNFTNGVEYEFTKLGLSGAGTGYNSATATFNLFYRNGDDDAWHPVTFADGTTTQFLPVLYGYFDLSEGIIGTAIMLTMVDGGGSANYINEVQLFGAPIPEPVTMSLLALGGLALLRRRR
ncbi:MAG: discoidin domain-containing protein [Phycisphaerae bacterium]|nr:discoidin domain-containing protein [Phycisphaerae bacterium]